MVELSVIERDVIYNIYRVAYEAHRTYQAEWSAGRCGNVLQAAFGGGKYVWRVVGITEAALRIFSDNNFIYKRERV